MLDICGDVLYSLHICNELAASVGEEKFDFHIQTNMPEFTVNNIHPNGNVKLNIQSALFIKSLLEVQPYINNVTIGDYVPENTTLNLSNYFNQKLNFGAGDIRGWYYNMISKHLPRNFSTQLLTVEPNTTFSDKIILIQTTRYKNALINYELLSNFKDHLVFCGLPSEYELFTSTYFNLPKIPNTNSLLEIAQYMAGSAGIIGNPSGLYAVAELLKIPRILIQPEYMLGANNTYCLGPVNVHPCGGWNESASTNNKLYFAIKELMRYSKLEK